MKKTRILHLIFDFDCDIVYKLLWLMRICTGNIRVTDRFGGYRIKSGGR